LASSSYEISINFYNLLKGSIDPLAREKELVGTLNLGDISLANLSAYGYQVLNVSKLDLLSDILNQERLYEALCSNNILLLEIVSKFKGGHQGKWLDGEFAFEVLNALINARTSTKSVENSEAFVVSPEFVFNYSISDSNTIQAISFDMNYSEIPQIEMWAYVIESNTNLCSLVNLQSYKSPDRLKIQFYHPVQERWISINYVCSDLNDNDPQTFSYFIDTLDFFQFDNLYGNITEYQLEIRFILEDNNGATYDFIRGVLGIEAFKVNIYYKSGKHIDVLHPELRFSIDVSDLVNEKRNYIEEIKITPKLDFGVYIKDYLNELKMNEIFHNTATYSELIQLFIYDLYNNKIAITSKNFIISLNHDSESYLYNFLKCREGKYFIDVAVDYIWSLKGFNSNFNYSIVEVCAYIKLTNLHIQAKIASIKKELISPHDIGLNNDLFSGDITNDGTIDIGFIGGFLGKIDNNERAYFKYSFSYLFDANENNNYGTDDPRIEFAEFVSDVKFTTNTFTNFLFDDPIPPFEHIILGDKKIINLTTNGNVDKAYLYLSNPRLMIGEFTRIKGSSNKFLYNWTDISNFLSPYYQSGDELIIVIELFDSLRGLNDSISYNCLLDFQVPELNILMGNGSTDYSSENYASPWTEYSIECIDNNEISNIQYQMSIYNKSHNLQSLSEFISLKHVNGTLCDLGIPLEGYGSSEQYYYIIQFKATDVAGNVAFKSSYFNNANKLLLSDKISIIFEDNEVDINKLYSNTSDSLNFTLVDVEGNEINNNLIDV